MRLKGALSLGLLAPCWAATLRADAPTLDVTALTDDPGLLFRQRARPHEALRYHVRVRSEGGISMSQLMLDVARARGRKYGRAGLGLSVARSLVRMHGGELWLKSALGKGATCTFRIPRVGPELTGHAHGGAVTDVPARRGEAARG